MALKLYHSKNHKKFILTLENYCRLNDLQIHKMVVVAVVGVDVEEVLLIFLFFNFFIFIGGSRGGRFAGGGRGNSGGNILFL